MLEMYKISIANDFTRYPSGRYARSGNTSGETFRETLIIPLLEKGEGIEIDFDGTVGYGSSFLEEAFGGLIRSPRLNSMSSKSIIGHLTLKSQDSSIVQEVIEYMQNAAVRRGR